MIRYHIELRKHNNNNDTYEVVDKCIINEYENGIALIDASTEMEEKHNLDIVDEGMMVSTDVTTRDLYVACEETGEEIYYSLEIVDMVEFVDEENDSKCCYVTKEMITDLLNKDQEYRELHTKLLQEKNPLKQTIHFKELQDKLQEIFNCERIIFKK